MHDYPTEKCNEIMLNLATSILFHFNAEAFWYWLFKFFTSFYEVCYIGRRNEPFGYNVIPEDQNANTKSGVVNTYILMSSIAGIFFRISKLRIFVRVFLTT